jgi:hypothetical protein
MPVEAVMANFMSAYQSSGRTVQIIVNADISAPPCVYVNPFKLAERPVENINIKTIGNLKGVSINWSENWLKKQLYMMTG